MKNAVIYARYSSVGQNEQSIDGQVRICKEFAGHKGLNIINVYMDKAKSGTNDRRPDFQKMIRDAESGAFQYVIVYMLDRFARNRMDSMLNKAKLHDCGVKVLSAIENISDSEEGEFFEMFLEWNAEKYSKRLSKRVRDGLDTSVSNGTFTGGTLIFGYKLDKIEITGKKGKYIQKVVLDEPNAEIIRFVFTEYAKGTSKNDIAKALNEQGHRHKGQEFKGRHLDHWLVNEKYTGSFSFGGRQCENMYPPIISREIFEQAQDRLVANRYFQRPEREEDRKPYILTGKYFCGHCGTALVADGGTSNTGKAHQYYCCKQVRKKVCDKKREIKEEIELYVAERTREFFRDRGRFEKLADDTVAYYQSKVDRSSLKSVEVKITSTKKDIKDLTAAYVKAVADGNELLIASCNEQSKELSVLLSDLENEYAKLELEKVLMITKKDILDFIYEITDGDIHDIDYQKFLIDRYVNSVYSYNDKTVIIFNVGNKKGGEKITLEDIKKVSSPDGSVNDTIGGELGIRTPEGFHLNGFQDRRFRPLSQLSIKHKCFLCGIILTQICANINKNLYQTQYYFIIKGVLFVGQLCLLLKL